ncbi:MAG: Acetyl-CoA:oxalate CoA-transferase [Arenicellales bacterium IbO2]|nr:MAG: Acetyl-CoA:oxalate CoA-transferase [Arenicellales bacterium IbO2]
MSAKSATTEGPLTGLLIADLTRTLAGPYATMMLADMGARVIKVEPPGGDDARRFGPFADGRSAYFASVNRGKCSIALDLKSADDRAIFEKLAARADVLVENYRPGVMRKLNYDWAALRELNPRLVYAAISGFGQSGPRRDLPAYDLVAQAMGGIMSITGGEGGPPVRVGTSIGDISAGLFALAGILAALHRRAQSGRGGMVDVGMLDCQVAMLESAIGRVFAGESPAPLGMRHPSIAPFDGFCVGGGEQMIIAAGNDALFQKLCAALGAAELANRGEFASNDLRVKNHAALKSALENVLAKKPAEKWLEILRAAGVPCAPINDINAVLNDPQVGARNMIIDAVDADGRRMKMAGNPVKMPDFPDPPTRAAAPELDADREAVLAFLGC